MGDSDLRGAYEFGAMFRKLATREEAERDYPLLIAETERVNDVVS